VLEELERGFLVVSGEEERYLAKGDAEDELEG
jgi:hypothetical protein